MIKMSGLSVLLRHKKFPLELSFSLCKSSCKLDNTF